MPKTFMKLSVAAVALALALPASAQDAPSADTVVASVNGTDITLGHMILVLSGLPQQYQQLPNDVLWTGILDQLVNQQLLTGDAAAQETRRVRMAMDNERRALLAAEAAEAAAVAAVSDEALQAAYDAQFADADLGQEYNASHILVTTQEEAAAIVETLKGGADFEATAREKSTGPSGPNGGALDWFGAGAMVPEFQAAVETLEVGAISDPVQTQFGWHVIKLNDKRQKSAPTLDAVRDQLTQELQQRAVEAKIAELTAAAQITRSIETIDPALLRNIDLLEN